MSAINSASTSAAPATRQWDRKSRNPMLAAEIESRQAASLPLESPEEQERSILSLSQASASDDTPYAEKVESLKASMSAATAARRGMQNRIREVLGKNGISLSAGDRLNIGVAGDGRIAVTGIKDKKLKKVIEEALNQEKGLGREISDYQRLEGTARSLLKSMVPSQYSVESLARIAQKNDGGAQNVLGTPSLDSIGLFSGNPELADMFREFAASDRLSISSDNNWAVDPKETIDKLGKNAYRGISDAVAEYNRAVREQFADLEEVKNAWYR